MFIEVPGIVYFGSAVIPRHNCWWWLLRKDSIGNCGIIFFCRVIEFLHFRKTVFVLLSNLSTLWYGETEVSVESYMTLRVWREVGFSG